MERREEDWSKGGKGIEEKRKKEKEKTSKEVKNDDRKRDNEESQ